MKRLRKPLLLFCLAALLAAFGPPACFLARAWWRDGDAPLPPAAPGRDDASRLNANQPGEVIAVAADPAEAERQLVGLVRRAAAHGDHISISGARHSMGGHTLHPGGLVLDMLPFNRMELDRERRILRVGAGARWAEVIPFLDRQGLSVGVMQSNNDFSVGGSLSVNCHGWQNDAPPICSTVESFRLLTADGAILRCSRRENPELFGLALGGYGLFGIILDAELRVVPNEFYVAEAHPVAPADYARAYRGLLRDRTDVGMVYGRLSVAPESFLAEGVITLLRRQAQAGPPLANTLAERPGDGLKRTVFRSGEGSDYGKNLRWRIEKLHGETGGLLSRNQILNEPADLYATRDAGGTDILHEYFIPAGRLGDFIGRAREVLLRRRPDLLNITVRNVAPDPDTVLRYAREEVFGLVMLFHQTRDEAAEAAMQALTRDLIEAALACGGTYYLPYRPHATLEQFVRAYPQAAAFFAQKRLHDPADVFQNRFYIKYGLPLVQTPSAGNATPAQTGPLPPPAPAAPPSGAGGFPWSPQGNPSAGRPASG